MPRQGGDEPVLFVLVISYCFLSGSYFCYWYFYQLSHNFRWSRRSGYIRFKSDPNELRQRMVCRRFSVVPSLRSHEFHGAVVWRIRRRGTLLQNLSYFVPIPECRQTPYRYAQPDPRNLKSCRNPAQPTLTCIFPVHCPAIARRFARVHKKLELFCLKYNAANACSIAHGWFSVTNMNGIINTNSVLQYWR